MHAAAMKFVDQCVRRLPPRKQVLEYGGRNINGTVRNLFNGADYYCIDLVAGPGVDKVADAVSFQPMVVPDTIICCEVLEHSGKWPFIVLRASKVLDPEIGVLILTCATEPRAPHSSVDGGQMREGEYYGNVDVLELTNVLDQAGFEEHETNKTEDGDLQVIAWKKANI